MKYFDLAAGRLRYHEFAGDGRPLVFVHGLGCASSCDYVEVAAAPALAGRRRILLDLLGSGFSDRPSEFGYSVAAHARCLESFIGPLRDVDLFAHSAGAPIAIVTASLTRSVRSLVLSEPNLDPGGGFFSRAITKINETEYARRGHARMVNQAQRTGDPIWAGTLAASDPIAVHRLSASLVAGSNPSWRSEFYGLKIPRTVIFGERSEDPDFHRLPNDGIAVLQVAGAGHNMAHENPRGLAEAIAKALAGSS